MRTKRLFFESKEMIIVATVFSFFLYFLAFGNKMGFIFQTIEKDLLTLIIGIVFSILVFFLFIVNKNTRNVLYTIMLFPFLFASRIAELNSYSSILIPLVIGVIGLFLHMIIYKTKLKYNKFIPCLFIYILALSIGGINAVGTKDITISFQWWYIVALLSIGIFLLLCLSIICSDLDCSALDMAFAITTFGGLIVAEEFLFITHYSILHTNSYFEAKYLQLGWGCSNTVAIVLLATLPFAFYLGSKKAKGYPIAIFLAYWMITAILCTISRGGIITLSISLLLALIYTILKSNHRLHYVLVNLIIGLSFIVTFFIIAVINPWVREGFFRTLSNLNFDTLNGRKEVYESAWTIFKANPILGVGFISTQSWQIGTFDLVKAHNTLLQMVVISGSIGFALMLIHLVLKYYICIKSKEEIMIILGFSFLFPEIYGMFDVSYLSCYTMVLVFSMFMYKEYQNKATIEGD